MQIDLRSIIDIPGGRIPFEFTLDLSDLEINFHHPAAHEIAVSGEIVNAAGILKLTAVASTVLELTCDRCISQFSRDWKFDLSCILAESVGEDISDEYVLISDAAVDVADILRTTFILDMDLKWLCSEDCKGLCLACGTNLNSGVCSCGSRAADPRLAALSALLPR